jgi:hypothetical protein
VAGHTWDALFERVDAECARRFSDAG